MILVQHIECYWTKASRGMPKSALRNQVPRELPVLMINTPEHGLVIHKGDADEASGFEVQQAIYHQEQYNKYWDLNFRYHDDGVEVSFNYCRAYHGFPERGGKRLFNLAQGDWGRFHFNGRLVSTSGQCYKQHFINIAYLNALSPDIFMTTQPKRFVDKMANLF